MKTSGQARKHVAAYLTENGFIGDETRRWPLYSMADWFVIGGRWSGALSRATWAKELYAHIQKRERQEKIRIWGIGYGGKPDQDAQRRLKKELERYWQEHCHEEYGDTSVDRDAYKEDGYSDDAMIITEEIYNALLKEYEGESDGDHFVDLESEPLSREVIGKKWVVVVDYHS